MLSNEKLLLGVSGGIDSMVMAHLFLQSKIEVVLAHCNFGLRGEESDADEAFVLNWAETNGVDCHVKSFDLGEEVNIQIAAREARYQWFGELLDEYGLHKVATAHHLNDSLETLLINLIRGTGIRGLAGISTQNGKVIRPLLFATREEIKAYALAEGVDWREDSSNRKLTYERNKIRHEVLPVLEKLNPSLLYTYAHTRERLQMTAALIATGVRKIKDKYLQKEAAGWRLDLNWISKPADALLLAELLSEYGFSYTVARDVFGAKDHTGKRFEAHDWVISIDRKALYITPRHVSDIGREWVIDTFGNYEIGSKTLSVSRVSKKEVSFESKNVAFLDEDKLSFPLKLRVWQPGDRFQPLGMKGMKKISDFLIDEKVPVHKKDKVLVLESNHHIVWVVGHRISEPYKLADATKNILKISLIS